MDRLLSQAEADALIALEKRSPPSVVSSLGFPTPGKKIALQLESLDRREKFVLDVTRGRIRLGKCTYQTRGRATVILVRVDLDGGGHQNPDGELVACPHIHTYREGFGDKWAVPLPEIFTNPGDLWTTLLNFFTFCHVTSAPPIQRTIA